MEKVNVCFDVGGTFIKFGIFNQNGEWQEKGKFPTTIESVDSFYFGMVDLIHRVEHTYSIQAIGLSFPGFVNPTNGYTELAGAITPLHGHNVINEFQNRLDKAYPIYIENDANCAALAEMLNGHAQNNKSFILITLGTGVGGAIIQDGKIVSGAQFRAGELGMMILDWQSSHYQTAHDLAATSSLVKRYKQAFHLSNQDIVNGEDIFKSDDDEQVKEIIDQWITYVGLLIFNLSATFNPEKILIGGGISQNPKLLPLLRSAVQKNPHWENFSTEIEICKHTNDAGLLGGLYLIKQEQGGQ